MAIIAKQTSPDSAVAEKLEEAELGVGEGEVGVGLDLVLVQLVLGHLDVADVDQHVRDWVEVAECLDGLDPCELVGNAVFLPEHVGDQDCAHRLVLEGFGICLQPLPQLLGRLQVDEEGSLVDLAHVVAELHALALLPVHPQHEQVALVLQVELQGGRRYFLHSNDVERLAVLVLLLQTDDLILDIGQIEHLIFRLEEGVVLDGPADPAILEDVDGSGGKRVGDFRGGRAGVELLELHHLSHLVSLFVSHSSIQISVVLWDPLEVVQQTVREQELPLLVLAAVDQPELHLPQELVEGVVEPC